jgi:hypothetical protein
MTETPRPTDRETYDLAMERAREKIRIKAAFYRDAVGLREGGTWGADLQAGTIRFDLADGTVLTAPMQVVGTYDRNTGTWMWGWDHPSVPAPVAEHAALVHAFGEEYGVDRFVERVIEATEEECWDFTALAVHLADAQGGYRGPSGTTLVYMTYGEITAYRPKG